MDSASETEKLLERVLGSWPDAVSLLWAILLWLVIAKSTFPDGLSLTVHATFLLAPITTGVGLWFWSRRIPKTKRNHFGFGVAIICETQSVRKKVERDFVNDLEQLLAQGETGKWFQLLVFPQHIARSLKDDALATNLRDKAGLSFLIFGEAKSRKLDGQDNTVIKLRGLVSHSPIPDQIQAKLRQEFTELFFPGRYLIPEENDLFAFEFTSQWANVVARYIIGIALLVSNQFDAAETVFFDLAKLLRRTKNHAQPVVKIKARLNQRLAEVHLSRALSSYQLWKEDKADFSHMEKVAAQIDSIDEKHLITAHLLFLRALCHFLVDGDTKAARAELKRIKGGRDSVWYFNMGFLYAYEGSMKKATHMYHQGTLYEMPGDRISDLESFMCWVLENDASRYQVHYCVGLLNENIKGDVIQAKLDYQAFLDKCEDNQFAVYQRRARKYIEENS